MAEITESRSPVGGGLVQDPKRLGRLIFGAIFLGLFVSYYVFAGDLPSGSLRNPGPGMFPSAVAIAGILVSLLVIVESLMGRAESGEIGFPRGEDLRNVGIFVAMIIAFVALLPFLGQYIASTLFAVAFLRVVGRTSWVRSLLIGAAMALSLSFFFAEILGLRLPAGSILP